jgi:putative transcriptional regulator
MMRVRLKGDGRIVEILADGSERALASANDAAPDIAPVLARADAAAGSSATGPPGAGRRRLTRGVRAAQNLQSELPPASACRSRQCATGSRANVRREAARALLKVIDKAPQVAFAVLSTSKPEDNVELLPHGRWV